MRQPQAVLLTGPDVDRGSTMPDLVRPSRLLPSQRRTDAVAGASATFNRPRSSFEERG